MTSCNKSLYCTINRFGPAAATAPVNNPLSYVLSSGMDNLLMHGSFNVNNNSVTGQAFMAQFIAENFNHPIAQAAINDPTPQYYPNLIHSTANLGNNNNKMAPINFKCRSNSRVQITNGDINLINAAQHKYLLRMRGGTPNVIPFDPTVGNSPKVTLWGGVNMVPEYGAKNLDTKNCPILNALLKRPWISLPFLQNVYATMKTEPGCGTKIGNFIDGNGVNIGAQIAAVTPHVTQGGW